MAKTIKIGGRLESVETGNIVAGANQIIDDAKNKRQSVINGEVDAELVRLDETKQGNLTFDNAPTEDSNNPVKSGGVYAADKLLSDAIEAILLLIPSAASALNKLVDMQTMNSSIATATATFRGTYNVVSDLELAYNATHGQISAKLAEVITTADNNDYAFVQIPVSATSQDIAKTERYKFNGEAWAYEYDLNNSGFTQAQWDAINSTITAALVSKLSALPTATELQTALNGKQDNLTFDLAPTSGSQNPVTSGGIYARNAEIVALITALDVAKQDVLTFDSTPTQNSSNPVTSNGVYVAVSALQAAIVALDAAKQNVLTFDSTPTLGSNNPVTSSGIKTELNRIDGDIVTLNNLYQALTQSALVVVAPTDTWPVSNPNTTTIYRVVDRVNTPPQYYSDYMWNGTSMVQMAQYDNAIDDVPTLNSNNLVKSGGIAKNMPYSFKDVVTLSQSDFEQGNISGSDGTNIASDNVIRTINKISNTKDIMYSIANGYKIAFLWYKGDSYLSSTNWLTGRSIVINGLTPYGIVEADRFRLTIAKNPTSATSPSDFVSTNLQLNAKGVDMCASASDIDLRFSKDLTDIVMFIPNQLWVGSVGQQIGISTTSYATNKMISEPIRVFEGSVYQITTNLIGTAPKVILTDDNGVVLSTISEAMTNTKVVISGRARFLYINGNSSQSFKLERIGYYDANVKDIEERLAVRVEFANNTISLTQDDFEQGSYNGNTGQKQDDEDCIRTIDKLSCVNDAVISFSVNSGYRLGFLWFKGDVYTGTYQWVTSGSIIVGGNNDGDIIPSNKFAIVIAKTPTAAISPAEFSSIGLQISSDKEYVKAKAAPLYNGNFIYAPSPQIPSGSEENADFNAETLTPSELYDAYDSLISKQFSPMSNYRFYPKYVNKNSIEANDASGDFKLKTYVFTRRNRFAWKNANRLYGWTNNGVTLYTDSCSPRIGDVLYSDGNRTNSGKTVSAYNSAAQSLTSSDSVTYSRDNSKNIAPKMYWSKSVFPKTGNTSSSTLELFEKNGASVGNATYVDDTHVLLGGASYERCESQDYHTDNKMTLFLWANEHGPQSDPSEPAIILYRLAKDLCGGCRNNTFLQFLKNYCKVVILPVANPYGMNSFVVSGSSGRNNYNNVNINRNYDTVGWASQADADKGSYAGDQPETQYIMNMCLDFEADVAVDIHCLGYVTANNVGRCHHEGKIPTESNSYNMKIEDMMLGFGMEYSNYGNARPDISAMGSDWIYAKGIVGGLIEMNAGRYAASYDGEQHTAEVMEIDYTLLLNTIRMWMLGCNVDVSI